MSDSTFPPDVRALLERPNPALLTSVRPDGQPVSVATWYLMDGRPGLRRHGRGTQAPGLPAQRPPGEHHRARPRRLVHPREHLRAGSLRCPHDEGLAGIDRLLDALPRRSLPEPSPRAGQRLGRGRPVARLGQGRARLTLTRNAVSDRSRRSAGSPSTSATSRPSPSRCRRTLPRRVPGSDHAPAQRRPVAYAAPFGGDTPHDPTHGFSTGLMSTARP